MVSESYNIQLTSFNGQSQKNNVNVERIYDYEDAIDLTGNGWYNRVLLLALSVGLLGMGVDVFGFSIIVTGCACDFQLELWHKSIMLSMPFIGPVVMAIPWGYISDTQGRRKSLLIALWGAFLSSFLSAFSFNWILLAILKVLSSMFSSAVQSGAYALLGECCSRKVKDFYMLIMTSVLMLYMMSYIVPAYFILQFNFAFNLGLIMFTPWRLLTIVMASPLMISALLLHLCYESPKFLLNAGQEQKALEYLRKMWMKNGGKGEEYPVHRVILKDDSKARERDIHILKSLWQQTTPLFQKPLVWKTLNLVFITAVIYSINNCWVMWLPAVVEAFSSAITLRATDGSKSLCSIISSLSINNATETVVMTICSHAIQTSTLLSGVTHGVVFAGITLIVSKLGSRKKLLLITFLIVPMLSSIGAVFNENNLASLVLFVGMTMTNLCMGVLFVYYVEMYPTSYRGMAACIGVMMARISGVAGVNLLGSNVMAHCSSTFYATAAILLAGVVVATYFLPPDRPSSGIIAEDLLPKERSISGSTLLLTMVRMERPK